MFSLEDGVMERLWRDMHNQDGSVIPIINLGAWPDRPYLTVQHPDAIKQILTSSDVEDFPKLKFTYDFMKILLGDGLVTSTGAIWKLHRRLLTPLFHFNILKNNASVMIERTHTLVEEINEKGAVFQPLKELLAKHAMYIIVKLAFGNDFDVEWMTEKQLKALKLMPGLGAELLLLGDSVARHVPFSTHKRGYAIRDEITVAIKKAIAERRGSFRHLICLTIEKPASLTHDDVYGHTERLAQSGSAQKEHSDLLSLMIDSSDDGDNAITDDEIVDEALTFLFAGYDTTSSSLCWIFYHLSRHPEVMRRLQQEVDDVLRGEDPTVDTIAKLHYTRNVVKESMRLTPVVPLIDRYTKKVRFAFVENCVFLCDAAKIYRLAFFV
jgi:cytochrome P450